jgi:hypothetical protein
LIFNDLPLDVATGVNARETVKASKVLLYGGSGGLMTFCRTWRKTGGLPGREQAHSLQNDLAGLPRPTVFCAHPGTAVNTLRSINPSVERDDPYGRSHRSIRSTRKRLPSGSSHYPREFRALFRGGAHEPLVDGALAAQVHGGGYYYADDDAYVIHRSEGAAVSGNGLDDQPEP